VRSEARAFRRDASDVAFDAHKRPRPLTQRISGLITRPIRSLSYAFVGHGCPCTSRFARVRRTTTPDSLPVWRPPPFTVGTFTPWVTIQSFRCYLLPL